MIVKCSCCPKQDSERFMVYAVNKWFCMTCVIGEKLLNAVLKRGEFVAAPHIHQEVMRRSA
jgi:hypothetical protein